MERIRVSGYVDGFRVKDKQASRPGILPDLMGDMWKDSGSVCRV